MSDASATGFEYVTPLDVPDVRECAFYHVMDLPGVGTVGDQWDLRRTIDDYLGRFDFAGKRVLDVGSASGFLTFEMEKRGGEVVSFDIREGAEWNLVPYATPAFDREELVGRLRSHIAGIKRAYWFAHRVLGSKARAYYGDIYDFPPALGAFDVVNFGMVLPHLRDPFLALQSASRLSRGWAIVTHQSMETDDPLMRFIPDPKACSDPLTWWGMSEGCIQRMLEVLGFEVTSRRRARHRCVVRGHEETCTTFVARRVHPPR